MNATEREELREKHRAIYHEGRKLCDFCSDTAFVGRITYFPCDTMLLLVATEPAPECDHIVGYRHGMNNALLVEAEEAAEWLEPDYLFSFCPKCGKDLR
jgi:hypothetical protein